LQEISLFFGLQPAWRLGPPRQEERRISVGQEKILSIEEAKRNAPRYNADRADVAQLVEQLIRNQ
jgi:hypothetical protein